MRTISIPNSRNHRIYRFSKLSQESRSNHAFAKNVGKLGLVGATLALLTLGIGRVRRVTQIDPQINLHYRTLGVAESLCRARIKGNAFLESGPLELFADNLGLLRRVVTSMDLSVDYIDPMKFSGDLLYLHEIVETVFSRQSLFNHETGKQVLVDNDFLNRFASAARIRIQAATKVYLGVDNLLKNSGLNLARGETDGAATLRELADFAANVTDQDFIASQIFLGAHLGINRIQHFRNFPRPR